MGVMEIARRACEALLDAVAPLSPRASRTRARSAENLPLSPVAHELLGTRITTLFNYRDEAARDLIRALKYDGSAAAARLAAQALADYLREELANVHRFSAKKILLVPIPLHKSRARERGFNQIELVLRTLPAEMRDGTLSALAPGALVRTKATRPQTRLHRNERLRNVAGAFEVGDEQLVAHTRVFLIDDVTTTGATLVHAAAPLCRAGAEVTLLALARA